MSDSVYTRPEDGGLVVQVNLEEGPRYHVRNVEFEGNTLFTDAQLAFALGVERGDVYNATRIDNNLNYTAAHTDVRSLYNDRGYLQFNAAPQVTVVPGDSLDLAFEINEGDVYEFGQVTIAGNTRTKDYVIRREIRTVPGQPYSRAAIERSIRELTALNYFDPSSFAAGPGFDVDDEDNTVDLTYRLVEKSADQLELSGGWGGAGTGLILTARVTFANFSVQNLLKGRRQPDAPPATASSSRSRSRPTAASSRSTRSRSPSRGSAAARRPRASRSATRTTPRTTAPRASRAASGASSTASACASRTTTSSPARTSASRSTTSRASRSTSNFGGLPEGISRELTIAESITRNALDNPQLPSAGSSLGLTLTVAPPIPGFIQYAKADFTNAWYTPVGPRLSASIRTRFGYIGSLTGDDVQFQRYLIGGTALEANGAAGGINGFGKDLVFMRGYPLQSIGPRQNGAARRWAHPEQVPGRGAVARAPVARSSRSRRTSSSTPPTRGTASRTTTRRGSTARPASARASSCPSSGSST